MLRLLLSPLKLVFPIKINNDIHGYICHKIIINFTKMRNPTEISKKKLIRLLSSLGTLKPNGYMFVSLEP